MIVLWIAFLSSLVNANKVLITGGAGFIGFHTASKLSEDGDNDVVVLDIFDDSYSVDLKRARAGVLKSKGVTVHSGDVCSRQMLDHLFEEHLFTSVIHLAGKEGATDSMSNPIGYTTANNKCLLILLEKLKEHKDVHLVYASTYNVYGNRDKCSPVSVTSSLAPPTSIYAALKIGMEEMVQAYCLEYQLSAIGLRLFSVYGPWGRPDGDIYRIASQIATNSATANIYRQKSSIASRDYTYIDDVVSGIMAALNNSPEKCGVVYNIGSGRDPVSMETIVELINSELGKNTKLDYTQLPVSEPLCTNADITHTKDELGYHPLTSIDKGIPLFLEWYKQYHDNHEWKPSSSKDDQLSKRLYETRIDYVNKKYDDRIARLRMKYQEYAEKNNIPVTKLYYPKTFIEIKGKLPKCSPQKQEKGKSLKELKSRCLSIDECVAFSSEGHMYSHVGRQKEWTSFSGTLYLADIDICQAGLISCYGNCTCKYKGPSQAEFGCEKGYGLVKGSEKYFCRELYSPDKPTYKEEEFRIVDKIENRDWNALTKDARYVRFKNTTSVSGTVALYPEAAGNIQKLKEACDRTYHCIGFTTNGDLKAMISPSRKPSKHLDLYVKDIDYCSLGSIACQCQKKEPGWYACAKRRH